MRNYRLLFTAVLMAVALISFGQKGAKGPFVGSLTYAIEVEGENIGAAEKAQMPTSITIHSNGSKTRAEVISPMYSIINIIDNKDGSGTMLFDAEMLGIKYAISTTKEDLKEAKKELGDATKDPEVKYIDETKVIAGYKCKKVEVVIDDNGNVMEAFYTEDIELSEEATENIGIVMKGVKGTLLEFSTTAENMTMKYICKEIKVGKPKLSLFVIPSDFEKITMKEFRQKMGGGE